jgi:transposase
MPMMPAKVYIVDLTEAERQEVLTLLRKGKTGVRKITRARILLKADEGLKDAEIASALNTSPSTVERTRKRFVEGGLDKALNEDPRPGRVPKLGEREEAHLIALACSDAPDGHDHWTLRMLADKVVELGFAESISHEAVRQRLKKMS